MRKRVLLIVVVSLILFVLTGCSNKEEVKDTNRNQNESVSNSNDFIVNEDNDVKKEFKIKEVEKEAFENNYTSLDMYEMIKEEWVIVEEQNNDLTIRIIKSDKNEMLLERGNNVTYDNKYTIGNVKSNEIENIFYGVEGQDVVYPIILLKQKDGTVKGINVENGYKTGEFIAENISGLNDVEKINQVDVTPPEDSGYQAIVAITKDGKVYEVLQEVVE